MHKVLAIAHTSNAQVNLCGNKLLRKHFLKRTHLSGVHLLHMLHCDGEAREAGA